MGLPQVPKLLARLQSSNHACSLMHIYGGIHGANEKFMHQRLDVQVGPSLPRRPACMHMESTWVATRRPCGGGATRRAQKARRAPLASAQRPTDLPPSLTQCTLHRHTCSTAQPSVQAKLVAIAPPTPIAVPDAWTHVAFRHRWLGSSHVGSQWSTRVHPWPDGGCSTTASARRCEVVAMGRHTKGATNPNKRGGTDIFKISKTVSCDSDTSRDFYRLLLYNATEHCNNLLVTYDVLATPTLCEKYVISSHVFSHDATVFGNHRRNPTLSRRHDREGG